MNNINHKRALALIKADVQLRKAETMFSNLMLTYCAICAHDGIKADNIRQYMHDQLDEVLDNLGVMNTLIKDTTAGEI